MKIWQCKCGRKRKTDKSKIMVQCYSCGEYMECIFDSKEAIYLAKRGHNGKGNI